MHNLDKLKKTLEEIEVPYERLAQGRKQAYQRVQMEKKRKQEWRYRLVLAAICVGLMVTAIRFVPTMIDTAKPSSDLEPFADHQPPPKEFFERLAITEKKNDLTFTLEGVAVEAKYMRIDYTVEAPYDISKLGIRGMEILQNDQYLDGSIGYHSYDKKESKRVKEKLEVYVNRGSIVSHENFELQITFDDKQQTAFEIPFSLENPLPEMPQYKVKETVKVEEQAFTVEEVTVSPLHTVIRFTTSSENDMTLYSIGRIALLDEKGREWAASEDFPVAFGGLMYGESEVLLENTTSKIPEKLTLVLEDMNALPKGEDYIVVDFNEKKVLEQPSAIQQKFEVGNGEIYYSIPQDEKLSIRNAVDATGKEWTHGGQTMGVDENGQHYTYFFESMPNPVKIYFYDYPNTLKFEREIVIYE